jgi:hypothetical protein
VSADLFCNYAASRAPAISAQVKGLGTGGAVLGGGDAVARKVEEVGAGVVDRDEVLNVGTWRANLNRFI